MQPRQANLLFDQIKVIQQPFARRGDAQRHGLADGPFEVHRGAQPPLESLYENVLVETTSNP